MVLLASWLPSQIPGGWYGFTLGPPIFSTRSPLAASAVSRSISLSMRKRGPRASKTVLGILFSKLRRDAGRLAIGRRQHQLLVEAFHIPAAVAKIHRQPVEQFRMTRPRSHDAEILGGFDDSRSKYFLPHPVDRNPCGQRIVPD